jgi:hypothetical protein
MYPLTNGAGDFLSPNFISFGAGDDLSSPVPGAGNYLPFSAQGFAAVVLASNLSGRLADDPTWYGQEGGYVVRLHSPNRAFTNGPYRVKLVDASGQGWPLTEPSCNSTEAGYGYECTPRFANTILQFAVPPTPQGLYRIRLYDADGLAAEVPITLRAVPTPGSREVLTIRQRMPNTVYNPYPEGGF